jgi:hypothetical protein
MEGFKFMGKQQHYLRVKAIHCFREYKHLRLKQELRTYSARIKARRRK